MLLNGYMDYHQGILYERGRRCSVGYEEQGATAPAGL